MKKGFTLVELLAVIVILAIILAIAIPGISNVINSSKVSSYNSQMDLIKKAASLYVTQYGDASTNSVRLDQLISNDLIPSSIKNPVTNQPFDNIVIDTKGSTNISTYEIYEGPQLVTGMIPVYYDDATGVWKKADKTNPNNSWYDYNNYKWANAVTVTSTNRSTYQSAAAGTTIPMSDINTMFVWIPRYKYLIPAGSSPREVIIKFETKYTPKSTGDAVSTYYTHPAFTFGNTELNGIWVGKFETSGTISNMIIKPDVSSIVSQTFKTMFESVKTYMQNSSTYGFTNDNDTHMMKNMEWGAIAYLYHSRYGKYGNSSYSGANKEIYLDNSDNLYTGRSMGAPGGSGILISGSEHITNGYYTYDGKCATINANLPAPCNSGSVGQTLADKTLAYGASTTGTIYGLYDMSGGAYEFVMAMYKPNPVPATGISDISGYSSNTTNSQYDLLNVDSKYYNQYLTNTSMSGDAMTGWYDDYPNPPNAVVPWDVRGGFYGHGIHAGIFFTYGIGGDPSGAGGFRITIAPTN